MNDTDFYTTRGGITFEKTIAYKYHYCDGCGYPIQPDGGSYWQQVWNKNQGKRQAIARYHLDHLPDE